MNVRLFVCLSFFGSLCADGCGGGGGGSTPPVSPTITSVSVSCTPASVQTSQTSQCAATVSGTGSYSSAVTWTATSGTVSSSGLYTSPTTVPASGSAAITATSTQDSTKSGSASVTINAIPVTITSVTVVCSPSSILTTQTSTCTPTVNGTGSFSSSVIWSVSPSNIGSVSIAGVFTPTVSGSATITATSSQDSTKSGSSAVKAEPTLLSVQPNAVVVGSTVSISATGVDTQNLNSNIVSFTQTGRVFTANPSAAAPQGANAVLTVPLPSGISPVSASASFAVPTTVSLSTNGVNAQSTVPIQLQPPAHALAISPSSAALSTSVPVSFSAVFTAFSSASNISSDDPGLTATNVSVASPTLITATINVAAGTAVGSHILTISSGGSPITFHFAVVAAPISAPVVTGLSSAQLAPGAPLTISGSGFLSSSGSPQAVIQYTYGGVAANVLETPISDSQLSTNIPLLLSPNTGTPFTGSVNVQVVVNGSSSNSVPIALIALPANTGTIGATTQAYLNNVLQQLNAMPIQTTITLPSGQTSFNSFLSASIQQAQQLQGQVSMIEAGGQVTTPDGSVITQSTIDVIDRLLQTSGTPSLSQLPLSAPASRRRDAFPLLHALSQTSGTGTVNLSQAALEGADSLCMDADVASYMSEVLTKETIGVCAASLLGWTAPVTEPVCGFLKLFTPVQIGVEIGNAVCDVAPINLAIITPSPVAPTTTVNGALITEAPTGIFKSSGNAAGQLAETATDAVLNRLELNKSVFQYVLGNKIAASVVNDAIQDAFTNLLGNVIDASAPSVFNFETNPVPLTMVSLEPSPNGFFSFSGLTMTPGSAAGTTSLYFDTSAFRSLDPSGNVTNVSSVVSGNQILATIQTSVIVSPSQANVASGGTVQFGASVLGVGPSHAGVSWGVDGITGGNGTVGVISSSGSYTAPASSGTHTITATSAFDGSVGAATVTVTTSTSNPVPAITALNPSSLAVGATPQTLTIRGTGFISASTVTFNGISHASTYVDATQLIIVLSSSDLAIAGGYPVVVTSPAPGGGASAAVTFTVTTSSSIAAVDVGTDPDSVAINPTTNKIYVANKSSNNVTVIDGATSNTTSISVGTAPVAIAVNSITNKIYVVNSGSNNVTVIDGATNNTSTVTVGTDPVAIAINSVTNKIYVVNFSGDPITGAFTGNTTVIDGVDNATTTVNGTGYGGAEYPAVAVNPVTNQVYVTNSGPGRESGTITDIDGATNNTTHIVTGATTTPEWNPIAVAVNPVTNYIYVPNFGNGSITVIDGVNNSTAVIGPGGNPVAVAVNTTTNVVYVANSDGCSDYCSGGYVIVDGSNNTTNVSIPGSDLVAVAVNPETNKIYFANPSDSSRNTGNDTVIVLDGATNTTTSITVGNSPIAIAVNPVTNQTYVVNSGSNTVTVIGPQ